MSNSQFFVLSIGIEPILQVPQTCVLSIERREQLETPLSYSKIGKSKI